MRDSPQFGNGEPNSTSTGAAFQGARYEKGPEHKHLFARLNSTLAMMRLTATRSHRSGDDVEGVFGRLEATGGRH